MPFLLFLIYNLVYFILIIFLSIFYLLTGKLSKLVDKMGFYLCDANIWIHGSSLGEMKIAEKFIKGFREKSLEPILLTVMTKTGYNYAKSIEKNNLYIEVKYAPFDFFITVFNLLDRLQIRKLILIETEIWPSYIIVANELNIKKYIINARISSKSINKYLKLNNFLKSNFFTYILKKLDFIFAESNESKKNFIKLGVDKSRIMQLNNIKFDFLDISTDIDYQKNFYTIIKPKFKNKKIENRFLTFASIRSGEENLVIKIFYDIKNALINDYNLISFIAPRHLHNIPKIISIIKTLNLKYILYSELKKSQKALENNFDIIIIDVFGELINIYKNSDIVFVGGSLVNKGGQNIIEPISLGKLTIFGKYMTNFLEISQNILNFHGAIKVNDENELKGKILFFLDKKNELEKNQIIHKGLQYIKSTQGSVRETIKNIFSM